jgi:protein-tyrosine phosphatase
MTADKHPIGVNFVCLGNICRSPMAEAVFQFMVNEAGLSNSFKIASSAVGNWHVGERPHTGTQAVLKQNGIPLNPEKRALLLRTADIKQYPYILALDHEIAASIEHMYGVQVKRLMEFAPEGHPLDVPDPYYNHKFDDVLTLVRAGCSGLLSYIRQEESI